MENTAATKIYALSAAAANDKIAARLAAAGAQIIRFPQIETERTLLDAQSIHALNDLTAFDWLVFCDVFAADYFLQTLEENGADFFELDALRVCAVGEAVADRLRFAQVHADVVPASVQTAVIVAALAAYVGETQISGARFLVIKKHASISAAEIENLLREKGARVSGLEIYRAETSDSRGETARLKALLAGGAVDEFVFAAPADFIALEEFVANGSDFNALDEILRDALVSANDEVTAQFLRERSLAVRRFDGK